MNIIKKIQAYMAYQSKVKQANAMFLKDGKRHFIIPFIDGAMDVLTRDEALTLKKQGQLPPDFTARTIYGAAFYWSDTKCPTATVKGKMPLREQLRRRKVYYRWFQAHHQ